MSCKYCLLFLFLCGFAALTVSEICKPQLLEGTSCSLQLGGKTDKSNDIRWVFNSDAVLHRKNRKMRKETPGLKMEEDGSLTFESVSLKNTGKYTYTVFNAQGSQTDNGEKEINVYAKAPKPTLKINCEKGSATLTCDFEDREDLTVSWYKEDKKIEEEKKTELLLKPPEVQENKPYSCSVSNPASNEESDKVTVCTGGTGNGSVPSTLFGFDFWIMVSILAGGGALLLLLLCVLIICACRSCNKQKQEQDEDELRLRVFNDEAQNGTARSKHTARGQPAPPIPQEDTSPPTPTQTPTQPKAQIRGRPPPPPEDDEEQPPPLPRPRNKQHRKRHEEPYRPME